MAEQRGEYRAIHVAMVDSPEFQALDSDARHCVLMLKLTLGASGIAVIRGGLVSHLAYCTALPNRAIAEALDRLERDNWLRIQGAVVWLRNGLRFEPSRSLTNDNHRKELEGYVRGLPRLQIVNDFATYYGIEVPFPNLLADGVGDGIEDGMGDTYGKHGVRSTENGIRNTDASGLQPDLPPISEELSTIKEVFDAWVSITGRNPDKTRLTKRRRSVITARLRSFEVADLTAALAGVMASDFHSSKAEYTELTSCLGNDEKVENHIARSRKKPAGGNVTEDVLFLVQHTPADATFDIDATYAELATKYPDRWARAGPAFQQLRLSELLDLKAKKDSKGLRYATEQQVKGIKNGHS